MADTELTATRREAIAIGDYKYGFHDEVTSVFPTGAAWTRTSCARSRRTSRSRSGCSTSG